VKKPGLEGTPLINEEWKQGEKRCTEPGPGARGTSTRKSLKGLLVTRRERGDEGT